MNASLFDLRSAAFSTSSIIFTAVLSPKSFVVRMRKTPLWFKHPDTTLSPSSTSLGRLSPVRATVSRDDFPSTTMPSRGMRSPGRTIIILPTWTSEGATSFSTPSVTRRATSGRISISLEILRRLCPSAYPSSISPIWKKSMTKTASGN